MCHAAQWQLVVNWHQHSISDLHKINSLCEYKRRAAHAPQLDSQAFSSKSAALAVCNIALRMRSLYKVSAV